MVERRKRPIDRCPPHTKDQIAQACVAKLVKRIIAAEARKEVSNNG